MKIPHRLLKNMDDNSVEEEYLNAVSDNDEDWADQIEQELEDRGIFVNKGDDGDITFLHGGDPDEQ